MIGAAEARPSWRRRPVGILPGVGPAFAKTLEQRRLSAPSATSPRADAEAPGRPLRRLRPAAAASWRTAATPARSIPHEGRKSISRRDHLQRRPRRASPSWRTCSGRCARRWPATPGPTSIAGRVVTLKLRATDFRIVTRRRTLPFADPDRAHPVRRGAGDAGAGGARQALAADRRRHLRHRRRPSPPAAIFSTAASQRALSGEKAIDALRGRFGAEAIIMGRSLKR